MYPKQKYLAYTAESKPWPFYLQTKATGNRVGTKRGPPFMDPLLDPILDPLLDPLNTQYLFLGLRFLDTPPGV